MLQNDIHLWDGSTLHIQQIPVTDLESLNPVGE